MNDFRKWIDIVNENSTIDQTIVKIDPSVGGGTGAILDFSDEIDAISVAINGGTEIIVVDPSLITPLDDSFIRHDDQHYDEIAAGIHRTRGAPEIAAGEMVRVDNRYGLGNGEGYGVFVANSLNGESVIVNIDGVDVSVPSNFVTVAPEEISGSVCANHNDGALSPMSFGGKNKISVERNGDDNVNSMDSIANILKALNGIEASDTLDGNQPVVVEISDEDGCDCHCHQCETCFPRKGSDHGFDLGESAGAVEVANIGVDDENEQINEIAPIIAAIAGGAARGIAGAAARGIAGAAVSSLFGGEDLDEDIYTELSPASKLLKMSADGRTSRKYTEKMIASLSDRQIEMLVAKELGVDPIEMELAELEVETDDVGTSDGSDDVAQLIADILYAQDMGTSEASRLYDEGTLGALPAQSIERIHKRVMGQ